MGVIPMPPTGTGTQIDFSGLVSPLIEFCNAYDDPFYINLYEPGFFFHSADQLFEENLPIGFQDVGTTVPRSIGPFHPIDTPKDGVIGYFDLATNKLYLYLIQIRPTCP
jgi:hypothetical protein